MLAAKVVPHNVALRANPPRLRKCTPRWIDGTKGSLAQQETMNMAVTAIVVAHDVVFRVDPISKSI